MILRNIICCLLLLSLIKCGSQNTMAPVDLPLPLKVQKVQTAIPVSGILSVGGFAGNRFYKNKDNYLKKFPVEDYIRLIEERTYTEWDWKKAEQPGKWIESSILTSVCTGDNELDEKVRIMYKRILDTQEPQGYIGVTSRDYRTSERPLRGMDPYELYFLQHALLTAYEVWNNPEGLEAARKLADYFVASIGPGKAEFWPSDYRYPENQGKMLKGSQHSDLAGHSIHYSWEGTLLIDPMLRLYQLTGDKRYFDWCVWVINNIDKWSGWNAYSNLDKVADGTMDINQVQPYVHAHTFHMNFLGFLRMYQITGDTSFLRKVTGAWDDIAERQMYITGGVSVGEHYERDYIKPLTGEMVETCATMSWMQLSQYMLELTGDTKYADAMERLLWNHIFAAQTIDGDCNRYHTPPNGVKPAGYYHGPDCCTASGHRLISMIPGFIYATGNNNDIYVNQFIKSEVGFHLKNAGEIIISQLTDYPEDSKVEITVNPAGKTEFSINIRIPGWCNYPEVLINGRNLPDIIPGEYFKIYRKWNQGDKIEIILPMELRWVRREHHLKVSDRKPYEAENDPDPPYALLRGPVVYVLDNLWSDETSSDFLKDVMKDVKFVLKDPSEFMMVQSSDNDILGPGYKVPVELSNGDHPEILMLPFANLGKWYRDKDNKPDSNSAVYSYAIWLKGIK